MVGWDATLKTLVTGGGGFLGLAIVRQLLERGGRVVSLARGEYPELRRLGVEVHQGDIADPQAVDAATAGCQTVFHVAAKAGVWGPWAEYYRINVTGTRNVITACRNHGVERLVYTSSPSVVYDGTDQSGVDESAPYPRRYMAHYPRTKAEAERMVLAANGPELATVALRPHLIWGPGDNHLVPRLVQRGRAGRLVRVKGGPYLVDSLYIDNAARAHLQAAERLFPGSLVGGRAYFLSQGQPMDIGELMDRIVATAGVPPIKRAASPRTLYVAGLILEGLYYLLRLPGEPPMTRFVARQLATAHWFDLAAARRDLGFEPTISIDEGLNRLRQSFIRLDETANNQA